MKIEQRGDETWLVSYGPPEATLLGGAGLLALMADVRDAESAAAAATRCGWLHRQQPPDLGPAPSSRPRWYPGAAGNASDFDFEPELRREGEPLTRWLAAGALVRGVRELRDAAAALTRSPGSEAQRKAIRDRIIVDGASVVWRGSPKEAAQPGGRIEVELSVPSGADHRWTWAKRLRQLPAADADLIRAAYVGAALRLQWHSEGHVALSASVGPGWVPESRGTDLYGCVLVALADELGRSVARLGDGQVIRCEWCKKPVIAARKRPNGDPTRKFCSDAHRWAARRARKRLESQGDSQ